VVSPGAACATPTCAPPPRGLLPTCFKKGGVGVRRARRWAAAKAPGLAQQPAGPAFGGVQGG
jgi:hypothetical protein